MILEKKTSPLLKTPEKDFHQLLYNARSSKIAYVKRQQYEVGKNIILNRLHDINNMIEKQWLNLSLGCFKM